jgi:hypothetical protein
MKRLIGHEDIDHILSREDEIFPSSGFAASVMDAVRREAASPPPIPFPWKRALPGLVLGGFVLLLVIIATAIAMAQLSQASTPQLSMPMPSGLPSIFNGGIKSAAIWTGLALLVALVSVKFSMRLASGRA